VDDAPPHRPRDVVAELYRRFEAGRLAETFELMSPDVLLEEPGDPDVLPWAGRFRGHPGLERFYAALSTGLSSIEIDPDSLELVPLDERRVLALGTERGVAEATGAPYESRSAWVWTVEDGRITHLRAFHDTAAMAAAIQV